MSRRPTITALASDFLRRAAPLIARAPAAVRAPVEAAGQALQGEIDRLRARAPKTGERPNQSNLRSLLRVNERAGVARVEYLLRSHGTIRGAAGEAGISERRFLDLVADFSAVAAVVDALRAEGVLQWGTGARAADRS